MFYDNIREKVKYLHRNEIREIHKGRNTCLYLATYHPEAAGALQVRQVWWLRLEILDSTKHSIIRMTNIRIYELTSLFANFFFSLM